MVAAVLAGVLAPGAAQTAAATPPGPVPTVWPGGRWQPDAARYGMAVASHVPVRMDDGVTLFANVGYPTDLHTGRPAAGMFPVLLTQNPYAGATEHPDPFYVDRGYIFASVGIRGSLDSEAPNDAPLTNDLFSPRQVQDGVALVDWAAHRITRSNGTVGLTGCSQLGIIQLFTAAALGPGSPVKAIVPACASNSYDGIYFAGGIPGPTIGLFGSPLASTLGGAKHAPENTAAGAALRNEVIAGGPRAYNGQYWQERTTSPDMAAQIVANGIPALLWSGWKAPEATGALEFYAALQNAWAHGPVSGPMTADQPATGRYQVVIGPWGHGQGLDESIQLEWYDTWLKGEATGIDQTTTPMHVFDSGAGVWVNAATYPVASSYTTYRLEPGVLADAKQVKPYGPGLISWSQGTSVTYVTLADQAAPIFWGQPDEPNTSLTYSTPPFTSRGTLAGPVAASIYATSSNTNLELIATLSDVGPDGTATKLVAGSLIGSMRTLDPNKSWTDESGNLTLPSHPFASDSYVAAGTVARYDIKLNPTVWSVQPEHWLQLTLTTQQPAANCASLLSALAPAVPCILTKPQQATLPGGAYSIEYRGDFPSSLNVPLLTAGSLPSAVSGTTPTSNGLTEPLGW